VSTGPAGAATVAPWLNRPVAKNVIMVRTSVVKRRDRIARYIGTTS
jgi:hypothetical protein